MSDDQESDAGRRHDGLSAETLASFAAMPSDDTGITTFERYLWQSKLAVLHWLSALTTSEFRAIVCEHVEDLAVVNAGGIRFAQLKTRDKGSWTVAKICAPGHAIDRLVKSYKSVAAAGIAEVSRFEVWLEGPQSEHKDTTSFFASPASASNDVKKKIRSFGIRGAQLTVFLERLSIHCQQPSRQTIDAVNVRLMGAIWPSRPVAEIETLYASLLGVAEAAQSGTVSSDLLHSCMKNHRDDPTISDPWGPVAGQVLTREALEAICPPLPTASDTELAKRVADGQSTLLELKLLRGGATGETVRTALLARADADVMATKSRAGGAMTDEVERAFDTRLLAAAVSSARTSLISTGSTHKPAEVVFHRLMSSPADMAALDSDDLFRRDHRLVVGHLCSLSDQCRFNWGTT